MESLAGVFARIIHQVSHIQPLIPTYLHLISSALFSIYIGAHASLKVPSSAAKPAKGEDREENQEEGSQQEMEGLTPSDAIMLPLVAGCTLASLYYLIKWLEDLTLLNQILSWYFSIFGVLSVARLLTDSMMVISSYIFPTIYTTGGRTWKIDQTRRKASSLSQQETDRNSPLPGMLSTIRLLPNIAETLWRLREFSSTQLIARAYVFKFGEARFRIGLQGFCGLILAVVAVLYFNLINKPWWLMNLLGLSFAYSALQLLSPTTFWTGTMILGTLFFYDIYFVFFTPVMVTVAKSLDIPAKLLFPRPAGPTEDPNKPALAMLGLGDIVLPGIMIGLALRFDLYLFYLRKQTRRDITDVQSFSEHDHTQTNIVKAKWQSPTGCWGERFWTSWNTTAVENIEQGNIFPKTYFYASLAGYFLSMITTLAVMEVYGHAQPALLYLVPGVLSFLWGTAFAKGDIQLMWNYTEGTEDENADAKDKDSVERPSAMKSIQSLFSSFRQEKNVNRLEEKVKETVGIQLGAGQSEEEKHLSHHSDKPADKRIRRTRSHIFLFSISLPQSTTALIMRDAGTSTNIE